MKNQKHRIIGLLIGILMASGLQAQTPSDAVMMGSRMICFLLDYNQGTFDQYWEGSRLRENQTIAKVSRTSVLAMTAIGITDNLNFYLGLPHITTKSSTPNGGKFAGVSDFQDFTLAVKYKAYQKDFNKGQLRILGTLGFSAPATNYLADYKPYAIGNGAPELTYRGIFQFKHNNGMYLRAAGAYIWRGYSEAEREYYYNNGSYYTTWMDVPNAFTVEGVLGSWLLDNSLQLELSYLSSNSLSGDDIRIYNAAQPTNKVNWSRVGFLAHYWVKKVEGLGFVAYYNQNVNGRNAPKMSTLGAGITYFFNYLKPKS
ncbi:MAG: transporter [Cytophagia bacterium]|nr:transporter [Cytophagia bacterium]